MNQPKVVVIGAGSYFFGRPAIWNTVTSEILKPGTLALVDTDAEVLATMMRIAERAIEAANAPTTLVGSTERRDVLDGADFVILTFSRRNAHFRGVDCTISAKHGVRMCSGDTIGPGGIFRALREIPVALAVARDMEELAPDGWLINLVNPTSVLGIALMRHAKVRSFALCDGNHEPHQRLHTLKRVGILPDDATFVPPEVERKLDLAVGGVNHCTWMVRFNHDGRDMMPAWREKLAAEVAGESAEAKAKPRYNAHYALRLMDLYGAFPTAVSHTKEYVPFFQGYGISPVEPEPIAVFDAEVRAREMAESWKLNEEYASGARPMSEFFDTGRADHATDIVESMWGGLRQPFYVNSPNRGAVCNLPDDAFLELRCDVDMQGPRPQRFGAFPRGVLALQHQVLDTHELTAEAAVSRDPGILMRAMMTDPIVQNIPDAERIVAELLDAEREFLPDWPSNHG